MDLISSRPSSRALPETTLAVKARIEQLRHSPAVATDAILVEGLDKAYPNGTHAVRGISFRVRRGEVFGILGPNGAGKSTTIGILGTIIRPTGGRALVDGLDVTRHSMEVRRKIGFAMQEAGVDGLATGREFLILQGRLYGVPRDKAAQRAEQLLKLFGLQEAADKRIKGYSGGMKRRIDLAAALIHLPKILFLDEPTEGLDPRSRQTMWRTLEQLKQKLGTTILLSTHYMEEADRLCDRIAIIDEGRIIVQDTPSRLKARVGGQSIALDYGPDAAKLDQAEDAVRKSALSTRIVRAGTRLHVYVANAAEAAPKILRALDTAKAPPLTLAMHQPTLEDVYLQFTGKRLQPNGEEKG